MQIHSTQIKAEEVFQKSEGLFTGDHVELFVSRPHHPPSLIA